LILGRAGTGKTTLCLREIAAKLGDEPFGPPLILLAPEQATFQLERDLAARPELQGMMRAQVLSFRRLAWQVFLTDGGASRIHLGDQARRMILRRLLEDRQGELKVFQKARNKPGFCDELARSIAEFKRYLITPAQLSGPVELFRRQGKTLLADKLSDLSVIYADLDLFLSQKFTDPDDYLTLLAQKVAGSSLLEGAELFLDGFTDFTPQELYVLRELLKKCPRVNLTLCLDSRQLSSPLEEDDCFFKTRQTYLHMVELCRELAIPLDQEINLDQTVPPRFSGCREMAFLEANLLQKPCRVYAEPLQNLKLAAATSKRWEVEGAAREILRLCRDEGYRFREIAVILRNLEDYRDLVETIFQDYGIPFFLDEKKTVMHHPLVELLRAGLELVGENWTYDPLFRCLKTELVGLDRDAVDRLENYVLAHGIRGKIWFSAEPWTFRRSYALDEGAEVLNPWEEEELNLVNQVRLEVLERLSGFSKGISAAQNVREITQELYFFLEHLGVAEQLDSWREEAVREGRLVEAREHAQVWQAVIDLLEQLVEALGDEPLNLEEYRKILDSGLESLNLGLIPPALDQTLVAALGRSRIPEVRAALLLGVYDGSFPAKSAEEGLINDQERETLAEIGLELAPTAMRQLFDEQYLIYTAFTRASAYLWVSYPQADLEGKALLPSLLISQLRQMFPAMAQQALTPEPAGDEEPWDYLSTPLKALALLVNRLRDAKKGQTLHPVWWDVYNWFLQEEKFRRQTQSLFTALFSENQETNLDPAITRELLGKPLKASVSRLETYLACPFQYFARYGLDLRERAAYELGAPDYGQFYHAVLKEFATRLLERNLDWGQITPGQQQEIIAEVVAEVAPRLNGEILLSSSRYRYLARRLERILSRAVKVLTLHAARGSFRPVGLELGFGPGQKLPPLVVPVEDDYSLELRGRIDRVDLAALGPARYLRVIDYKSGNNTLRLDDLYHGLNLQLLTYLTVALENSPALFGGPALPAGMFYFKVHDPFFSWKDAGGVIDPEVLAQKLLPKFKLKGFALKNLDVVRLADQELSSRWSDILPVAVSKNGQFHQNSSVLEEADFQKLTKHLHRVFKMAGEDLLNGQVAIAPYKKQGRTPCQYCTYHALCRFDVLLPENNYRTLKSLSREEVLKALDNPGEE